MLGCLAHMGNAHLDPPPSARVAWELYIMITTTMLVTFLGTAAAGQFTNEIDAVSAGVRFELLAGSTLTDLYDLSPGDPVHPIRGSFVLRLLPTIAPFPTYSLTQIRFETLEIPSAFIVRGSGFYHLFGSFPNGSQQMQLEVAINQNAAGIAMTSGLVPQESPFPAIEIEVSEVPTGDDHHYILKLIAEPLRQLSFSTEVGLTSGHIGPLSAGDMLCSSGRILRTQFELTWLLGIMPPALDIGLNALGQTPATNSVLFSGEVDIFSETVGPIQNGDMLNEHGFIALTNQQLTAGFGPQPVVPDAGLDAFHVNLMTGELWFSLEAPLFSEALGITLQPGDVLCDAGYVLKTNAQLLERFEIVDPAPNGYGLDAVTRLPNGTILFSVEEGFIDSRFGPVEDGDLLSDNGHLVRRNLTLVWPFEPLEDLNDFGLDALQAGPVISALDGNADGAVNLLDYAAFEACLTGPTGSVNAGCVWADFDSDETITFNDFAAFQQGYSANEG